MKIRSLQNRSGAIRLGMLCLLLASAVQWFLHPAGSLGGEIRDGALGVLYGLSIGLNLYAVRLGGRRNRENDGPGLIPSRTCRGGE